MNPLLILQTVGTFSFLFIYFFKVSPRPHVFSPESHSPLSLALGLGHGPSLPCHTPLLPSAPLVEFCPASSLLRT